MRPSTCFWAAAIAVASGFIPPSAAGQDARPAFRKPQFIRGDGNTDGRVDISDALHGLGFLFLGTEEPSCLAAADSNGDQKLNLTDPIFTLFFIFLGNGSRPPEPGPRECGVDPADAGLTCASNPSCPDDFPLVAHVLRRITFGATEELYRAIQTRKDLVAYIEEQLGAPDGYDPRIHEPEVHARVEGLGIGHEGGAGLAVGNAGEQLNRLKASLLVHALGSRWQLLQVITQFWNNHFHTEIDSLRETFFSRGGRGGPALPATQQFFAMADADASGLITEAEWEAFRTIHPGLISWDDFGRRLNLDGTLTQDEFLSRNQIAYWKYTNPANELGIAAEMEKRENEFFRRRAFGRFRELVEGSAKGVPMLIYLNGFENTARAPNENYAREILELFVLGVDHVYTQRDIEQLSKLLTGWSVGWVERAGFDPAADPQWIRRPGSPTFPLNLREPRPLAVPTRQFWEDELYTWAFVLNVADHDWSRKDLFLTQYGGVDSLGNPVASAEGVQVADNAANRTVAAAIGEFNLFLDRLVSFRDCRKFISSKLIQLLVTDDLGALARERPAPPEVEAAFRRVDLDGDGALRPSEWEEPIPLVLPNGRPPDLFLQLDRDADGRVTLSEYREPDLLLAAMARWEETGGDMREVLRTILLSDEFLSLKFQDAKVKTPFEQVTSTLRVLNAGATDAQLKVAAAEMSLAGMDLFQFGDPTGESEMGFDWMHTIGLLERLKWINRGVQPEDLGQRRFNWSPSDFISRYRLSGRDAIADFFIQLIHPQGVLSNDRLLALQAFDQAASARVEAMVAQLLGIAPAMKQ